VKRSALGSTGVGTGVAVGGTVVAVDTGAVVGAGTAVASGAGIAVCTGAVVGSETAVAVGGTGVSVDFGTAVGAVVATGAVSEAVSPPPEQAIPIAEIIKLSIRNFTSFIGPPIYSFNLLLD